MAFDMNQIHIRALNDDELLPQLESGDSIFFLGRRIEMQDIERQIDRLGFGERYIVSATQGPNADRVKVRLKPLREAA
jgi:hypothetical protein